MFGSGCFSVKFSICCSLQWEYYTHDFITDVSFIGSVLTLQIHIVMLILSCKLTKVNISLDYFRSLESQGNYVSVILKIILLAFTSYLFSSDFMHYFNKALSAWVRPDNLEICRFI